MEGSRLSRRVLGPFFLQNGIWERLYSTLVDERFTSRSSVKAQGVEGSRSTRRQASDARNSSSLVA